jgi:beta-phosphoglucomutase-like phosphatase (HAD superfamily)
LRERRVSQPKFISADEAARRVAALGEQFALVANPAYVHPPVELYPLAPKIAGPVRRLAAAVMDMDGTTTTTETLCLHSLEQMVRRITGRPTPQQWAGLDRGRDYPHVIGNSTTRHVEYLIRTYGPQIRRDAFARALLEAALWQLAVGADPKRRQEVAATLRALGWADVPADPRVQAAIERGRFDPAAATDMLGALAAKYEPALRIDDFADRVRGAIDVYYYRYHEILAALAAGEGAELAQTLTGGRRLIEPMPAVGVFLALVKGWLGEAAGGLYELLCAELPDGLDLPDPDAGRRRLARLGTVFAGQPLRIAVVTSSIRYEADIVLGEVLSVLREQVAQWPVCRDLAERFSSVPAVWDAFVTASDSSEIRLKPHRDLYSIALHALGVGPGRFGEVVGFEDSESGTIAIRAAGVGLCVAVPFADTAGHDLSAAAHVLRHGLAEAILKHNLFVQSPD